MPDQEQWDLVKIAEIKAKIDYLSFKIGVYEQYLRIVEEGNPSDLRLGQLLFNALAAKEPAVASILRGSQFDPFYKDAISPLTDEHISGLWSQLPRYSERWVVR